MKSLIFITFLLNFYFVICVLQDGQTCTLKPDLVINNGRPGICVHFKKCTKVKELWRDKLITVDHLTICDLSKKIICCPTEERISQKKCKEYGRNAYFEGGLSPIPGQRSIKIKISKCRHKSVGLIVGGEIAKQYEFPHQALLGYSPRNNDTEWLCGGSLVSPNFVLTAAHCLFEKSKGHVKQVKVGMYNMNEAHDNDKVFIYNIRNAIKHPNYNDQIFNEDIALLKLDGTVPLSEFIMPICLPTKRFDSQKAMATGFGKTRTEQQSDVLLKVVLEPFTHSECQESWPEDGLVKINEKTMLCFGHHSERKDTCRGDSGGPLQISNDENVHCTYTQIGISSFGPNKCGMIDVPSAYTNVFNYVDWIEGIVWKDDV